MSLSATFGPDHWWRPAVYARRSVDAELEQVLAGLAPGARAAWLDGLKTELDRLPPVARAEFRWRKLFARPAQIPPGHRWNVCIWRSGRGFGKTRCLTEWARHKALTVAKCRIAVVGATYADARDTMVEGPAGLLAAIPKQFVAQWNRSLGELLLTNGTRFRLFGAEAPERLRGPQHHFAICDEIGAWPDRDAWDMLQFGLRQGKHPQVCAATTPRPTALLKELERRAGADPLDVVLIRGTTFDNAANLPAGTILNLRARYEGTRLGRQELYGELLLDVEGAIFHQDVIDAHRRTRLSHPWSSPPQLQMKKVVVGVDPAVRGDEEASAETGIVVVGLGIDDHGYVLADRTLRGGPETCMRRVADTYHEFAADIVVVERNNGGDYLPALLKTVDPSIPCSTVHASRGKATRAQPVASLYEQGRVHHTADFPDLETQMCSWDPEDLSMPSPDRVDALVWAVSELMVRRSQTESWFDFLAPLCPRCSHPTMRGQECPCPQRGDGGQEEAQAS